MEPYRAVGVRLTGRDPMAGEGWFVIDRDGVRVVAVAGSVSCAEAFVRLLLDDDPTARLLVVRAVAS